MSQITIGRLHRLECGSVAEYQGFSVGETIQAKVLKVTQGKLPINSSFIDKEKTWIELTRRREHMHSKGNTLDSSTLNNTLLSVEDLKAGQ